MSFPYLKNKTKQKTVNDSLLHLELSANSLGFDPPFTIPSKNLCFLVLITHSLVIQDQGYKLNIF
jgi:hypothetical protein